MQKNSAANYPESCSENLQKLSKTSAEKLNKNSAEKGPENQCREKQTGSIAGKLNRGRRKCRGSAAEEGKKLQVALQTKGVAVAVLGRGWKLQCR